MGLKLGWDFELSGGFENRCVNKLVRLFVVLSISVCALGQRHPSEACSAPIWSAVLIPRLEPNRVQRYWEGREESGITFLDDEHLILHQVHIDMGQLSSRQSADVSSPFRLQASLVDAKSGKPLLSREWGTRSEGTAIVVHHGGVIVRTGDTLRVLSNDFVELQKAPLQDPDPGDADVTIDWDIFVSASRRSVLFNHYQVDWEKKASLSQYNVLDGDTFEVREAWEEVPALHHMSISVSDKAVAYVKHVPRRDRIFISEFGSRKWKPLWERSGEACYDSNVFALIADKSFIYACREFSFVSGGQVLMREKFGKGERPVNAKLSVADNGRFIAISLSRISVNLRGVDLDPIESLSELRVVVYDLVLKKRIQTIEISPLPRQYYDFALSPDGSRLAILNDRTVSVCELPRQPRETQKADVELIPSQLANLELW
jgi:hypothetical protein